MTQEELNRVLENHLHWFQQDCDGWDKMRAVLDGENLDGLNLNGAVLNGASLNGASLNKALLNEASLNGASLNEASLNWASLNGTLLDEASINRASLNWASLNGAVLNGSSLNRTSLNWASLNGALLNEASLNEASLNWASLNGAVLNEASLNETSLNGAVLNGASLDGASLNRVINLPFIPFACPDIGAFIGWKKSSGKIIKLEIPEDAKRCSATSDKCRCNKAKVLEIQEIDGSISDITKISSDYDIKFIYEVGKTVSVKDFCEDRWRECSQGIHFFINRQSAVEY